MSKYYVGVAYYPEWWAPEEWEQDFAKMQAMGINCIRMGEFAWSWFEPEEGKYNFEPMRKVVDLAANYGISVVMGTVSAVVPAWLYKKYPEVKGGNLNGDYTYGGRKGLCLSSEIFREYVRRITEEEAKALGDHPNIVGWQIDNEPGYPFAEYDARCEKKFQRWLKKRYGTIEKLNDEWVTMVWSNQYNDFDEIHFPTNQSEGAWFPGLFLCTRRFFSDNFNSILEMQAQILRKYIAKDVFLYTNWPGANWSVDCFRGSEYLDYAAWDNYIPMPSGEEYRVQLRSSMEHDFDRRLSNGKEHFLVAEQTCCVDANTMPEGVAAQSWLDIAQGAFGTMFFEWRTALGGVEQNYGSLLRTDLTYGNTRDAIARFSAEAQKVWAEVEHSATVSDIASLYSYESSWATAGWTVDGPYDQDFFNIHGAFRNALRRNLDVVGIQDDLSKYRMVLCPGLKITTDEYAEKLINYVAEGGILVLNRDCGMYDTENKMYTLLVPGKFRKLCGVGMLSQISPESYRKMQPNEFAGVTYPDGSQFAPWKSLYTVEAEDDSVETLATYTAGLMKGKAAITLHPYGKGWAVYLCTDCDDYRFYEKLAKILGERFNFAPMFRADDGILAASRVKENGEEIFFAVNMTGSPKTVTFDSVKTSVITGEQVGPQVIVPAMDAAVVK